MGGGFRGTSIYILLLDTEVKSLNQASTILSREFEPSRMTHTGSVFRSVWYEEDNKWQFLGEKRLQSLKVV